MLRTFNQNFGTSSNLNPNKHSDAILRHKARNLRAKVKCLLPVDVCKKYGKRNRHIKQNCQRRQFLQTAGQQGSRKQGKHQWKFIPRESGKKNQWFFEKLNQQRKHLFEKLCKEQIEQIKEDKLYYLGNQHVQAFEDFLFSRQYHRRVLKTADAACQNGRVKQGENQKQWQNQRNQIEMIINRRKNEKATSQVKQFQAMENAITSANTWLKQLDRKGCKMSASINTNFSHKSRYTSIQNKFEVFHEKRKMMEQESAYKKQMNKILFQKKQMKAQNKFFQLKNMTQKKIKLRNQQDQKKRHQARKIVKQKDNIGEIKGLTEQLRQICLSKPLR